MDELIQEYLTWLSTVRRRQPATISAYAMTLRLWCQFVPDAMAAATAEMEAFQVRPAKGGTERAISTQAREVTTVKLFYKWLAARGHIEASPYEDYLPPTVRAGQPKPIADHKWKAAWRQDITDPLRVALGLGYFCGLRRAEIFALSNQQITDHKIVDFVRKGGGEDVLPWRSMVRVYEDRLTTEHLGQARFERALNRLRGQRGPTQALMLADDPIWLNQQIRKHRMGFTPHQLRHSCATNMVRADVPLAMVSRLLNHSSLDTTMRYVKSGGDELRGWLRASTQPSETMEGPIAGDDDLSGRGRDVEGVAW